MRHATLLLTAPIVATCVLALGACETAPKSESAEPAPAPRETTPARPAATLEGRLDAVKPQLAQTMGSLSGVVANRETPALGSAVSTFRNDFERLRRDADRVIAELDEKRRESDAWFLDRERTVAITSQPGVLESREDLGFVGEYLVQLRRDYQLLMGNLTAIDTALAGAPTAASVDSVLPAISAAQRNSMNVENDITVLLAEMRRVNFGT